MSENTDTDDRGEQKADAPEPNICRHCGWRIGPIEYNSVADDDRDESRRINYCGGCGIPVEQALGFDELVDGSKLTDYDEKFRPQLDDVDLHLRAMLIDLRDNHPDKENEANEAYARGDIGSLLTALKRLRRKLDYGHGPIGCHGCGDAISTGPGQRAVQVRFGHVVEEHGDGTDFVQTDACYHYCYECYKQGRNDG